MFNDYLTIDQASKEVGCTRRTLYRIIDKFAPGEVVTPAFGRQLIHISKLPALREHYFPFGSERRSAAAKIWGKGGGTQKKINLEDAKSSRSGTSGKAVATPKGRRRSPAR
jgi:hypothetical protein